MISPEEIKVQALKWWKPLLQTHIAGETFFPRPIDRIGRVQSQEVRQRFEALQQEINALYQQSKNQTGVGYLIKTADRNFRRTGIHALPSSIEFETLEDFLYYTGKKKEWKLFLLNYDLVIGSIPALKPWAVQHPFWLINAGVNWGDVMKVCRYFMENAEPNLYIRQLPIEIHTKFIEENLTLLQLLLGYLIPGLALADLPRRFEEKYFLKFDQPLIRIRVLDPALYIAGKFPDISLPLTDFEWLDFACDNILITENKMNFLTLPNLPRSIAVWSGGGFNVSYLRNASWLNSKRISYWGDIDEHGFQILHQLRSYYPQVKSILMDRETFEKFQQFSVAGSRSRAALLPLLTDEEAALYWYLKSLETGNRLEQEKITQKWVDEYFTNINLTR